MSNALFGLGIYVWEKISSLYTFLSKWILWHNYLALPVYTFFLAYHTHTSACSPFDAQDECNTYYTCILHYTDTYWIYVGDSEYNLHIFLRFLDGATVYGNHNRLKYKEDWKPVFVIYCWAKSFLIIKHIDGYTAVHYSLLFHAFQSVSKQILFVCVVFFCLLKREFD